MKSFGHPALGSLIFLKYAPEMEWLLALVPALLMGLGGLIVWLIKSRIEELRAEELRAVEAQLREQRQKVYSDILAPYTQIFSNLRAQGNKQAIRTITSYEYRRTSFELTLFGSDEVVRAYNDLTQHSFKAEAEEPGGDASLAHFALGDTKEFGK